MVELADTTRHIGYGIIGVGLLMNLIGLIFRQHGLMALIMLLGFPVVLLGSIVGSVNHLILGAGIGAFLMGVIFGPIMVYLLFGFLVGSILIGGCFIRLFPDSVCRDT